MNSLFIKCTFQRSLGHFSSRRDVIQRAKIVELLKATSARAKSRRHSPLTDHWLQPSWSNRSQLTSSDEATKTLIVVPGNTRWAPDQLRR
uniref:Uncharacterized protein n=1 Tax=Knipowitschia caucasica TaxID=637954 RepID=A0AAV2L138_KNICA